MPARRRSTVSTAAARRPSGRLDLSPLARYRPMVDDWDAFAAALARPLPGVVWTNRLRCPPEELADRLAAAGIAATPIGWHPGAFRLPSDARPGTTLEYAAGLCHVQEEVSLVPAVLLAARPGERVLDLCAAPGNKTAQLAVAMGNRGTVVANDRAAGRLGPLRRAVARLGLVNVATTVYDAVNYPRAAGLFDRVLVDAPCTCEGTSRKSPEVLERDAAGHRQRLATVQRLLLATAIRLARPGGQIVYATCTYAPEENELVIDDALRKVGSGVVSVVPAGVPGLVTSPAVTEWRGRRLAPELSGALRVWPHQNDTGGFFVAVLEKSGEEGESGDGTVAGRVGGDRSEHADLGEVDPVPWLAGIEARFGIPAHLFEPYRLVRAGRKRLALVSDDLAPPAQPPPMAVGLPLLRADSAVPKLSTAGAMAFGSAAARNAVETDRAQAEAYLGGAAFEAAEGRLRAAGDGYVIVRHRGTGLGVGLLRRQAGGGRVESLYPKGWRLSGG